MFDHTNVAKQGNRERIRAQFQQLTQAGQTRSKDFGVFAFFRTMTSVDEVTS